MRVLQFLTLIALTFSCISAKQLDNWDGDYLYNEKPVKALAGYNMVMIWTLKIKQENKDCIALIEVDGQQTHMVIRAIVSGDDNSINLTFDKGIDGMGYDDLKKGDHLLQLKREKGKIKTKWDKLEPILDEEFKNDTVCFELEKN